MFAGAGNHFSTFPPTTVAPLHRAIRAILDAEAADPSPETLPVAELRALRHALMLRRPKRNEPVGAIEDRTVPGPDGPIAIRIYRPAERPGRCPIVVFFHGGGWVLGTLDTHDDVCRTLANRASALVVSVDYRRAPEYPFPAPLEDCYAVTRWCALRASEVGGDETRLAVAGDSAGGNLAAAVALRFRDEAGLPLALQALIYPVTNCAFDTASYHQYATGFGLTRDLMRYFWKCYLTRLTDADDHHASPLRADDLAGLPPALILTAQYDVLRDEGEAYAARLAQAGVSVRCTRYLEMNHGFIQLAAVCDPALRGVLEVADELRTAWAR